MEIFYGKEDHGNYIRYVVFSPERESKTMIFGPGGELIIEKPRASYDYFEDNIDWERVSKRVKLKNIIGQDHGQGIGDDGNFPLFNMFYTPPIVKILNSHKDYRSLSAFLIMFAYIDCILIYNSGIVSDQYVSTHAERLFKKFDREEIKTINRQTSIVKRREEDLSLFDSMNIEVDRDIFYKFDNFMMHMIKVEYKKRIFGIRNIDTKYVQELLF